MFGWNKNKKRATVVVRDRSRIVPDKQKRKGRMLSAGEGVRATGFQFGLFLDLILLVAFLATAGYVFIFSSFLAVRLIEVAGTERLASGIVSERIRTEMEGKIGGMIPRDNIIFISKERLARVLREEYGVLDSIAIEKKFPDRLLVRVTERDPRIYFVSRGEKYVVDAAGVAYVPEHFAEVALEAENLLTLRDGLDRAVVAGERVIQADYLNFVLQARMLIKDELGFEVESEVLAPQLASGDAFFTVRGGWKVYVNQQTGAKKGIEMLRIVLREKIDKSRLNDLEYVDVRSDNKVYYKFRGAEQRTDNQTVTN